jgi:hypothetical protein
MVTLGFIPIDQLKMWMLPSLPRLTMITEQPENIKCYSNEDSQVVQYVLLYMQRCCDIYFCLFQQKG